MEKQTQQPKKPNQHNNTKQKNPLQENQTPLRGNQEIAKDFSQKKQQMKEQNKMKNNEVQIEIMEGERNNGRGDEGDEGNQQNWESDNSGMEDENENEQLQQQEIIIDQNYQQFAQDQQEMQFDDDDEQYDSYEQEEQIQNKTFKLEIKKMDINSLSPLMKIVLENLSNNKSFIDLIKMPPSKKIKKQVCAKVITAADTVIQCFDCRMDPTCIICEDCFKNGNHEGHRYVLKKFAGGCCDCGDPEAWSEKGFCKNHSGLFKDFQVQPQVLEQFTNIMDGLFYLYFYLLLTNDKSSRVLTQKLLMFLNKLNNENTYYNKLTAHCLTRKLPAQYSLNEKLDNKTILQNILTSKISGNYFKKWFDLFINMFPYYPFKLDIIKHYIQNYGDIVDGAQGSANKALSISCQIMTSYKVVDQYSKEYNIGIGQRSQTPIKTKQLFEYCKMYFHDIYSLTTLSEKASFNYWKMHINSKQSIRNLFHYYRILLKKVKSYQGENSKSQVQIIAKFINFSQTQQQLIEYFAKIIKIVSQQPKLVQKVIYVLWKELEKVNKEYNPESLCILRPIQRCLTLALFQYFDCSLENMEVKKQKLIKDVLKINEDTFEIDSSITIKKIFKTLFFYSKTQSSSGLAQTSYVYLYFYKINQRLLSMVDFVCLKMFLLLVGNPYPLTFESIMELNKDKITSEAQTNQAYLKQQQLYFASCLIMSKLVFTTLVPEIYLAYTITPEPVSQTSQYKKEIKEIILNFFKEKQSSGRYQVPQIDLKSQLLEGILPSTCKIAEKWVKTNCTINKNKKVYVLDSKLMDEQFSINPNINGLNFDDFMISLSSKDAYSDINKSIKFITGYNVRLFNLLWNNISLESLHRTLRDLYNQSNKQLADSFNYTIVLPTILTVYILTKTLDNPNKSKNMVIITEILKEYLPRMPKNILSSLAIHIDSQEQISVQKQKIEQEINLEKQKKKQKSNEIKLKKLESMKKKQQQFLQKKYMIQEQQQIPDKLNKNTSKQNEQTLQKFCNICKNELNQNSIYILNFTIRDHEKLLKLGKGLQCISLNSCRHMFDYDCIKSMYKKNNYVDSITCSLCKFQGNVIFPASSNFSEKLAQQIHDRFIQLLFIIKENADFYEEIIKSFYHYVLLCGLDFERITNKKGQLYRTLLAILKKYIPSKQIDSLKQKLLNKKISKGFEKSLKTPSNIQRPNISFFFNLLRNENIQEALDMQAQLRMDIYKQQSIVEPKKRVGHKEDEKQNYTQLFFIVVSEILEFLSNKNENQKQEKMEEENEQEERQQMTFVKDCLKTITGSPNIGKFERSSLHNIDNKNSTSIFKKMPQKYIELSINKKCRQCSQISQQAIMCLQCDWVGCQKSEKCLAKTHINEKHGQVGAIMIIQKSSAYYITSQKYTYAGDLYQDEWENNILKTEDWNNFELNTNLLQEMERNILLDDIPTRHFKKKTA